MYDANDVFCLSGLYYNCGHEGAELCINPYNQDLFDEEIYEYLCEECYNEYVCDI